MKKIVIDCRYLGMSGIGRVLEGYINNMKNDNSENYSFYFLGDPDKLSKYGITERIIEDLNYPVSKKGLFVSKTVNQFDAFFTPNFIIPFGIKIPVYTMIHDLMFLDFKDTTNGFIDSKIKKYLYNRCIKKSKKIFVVSKFTSERIRYYYPKMKCELVLVYNGLSQSIMDFKAKNQTFIKKDYIIFVGNMKKQKGIKTLLEAVNETDIEVYLIGEKNNFRTSDDTILEYFGKPNIHFTGRIDDEALYQYIAEAKFLVQPSLYEGFGLPPLEALYLGTKPIISDIPVFKEIYSELDVEFFKCGDVNELKDKLIHTSSEVSPIKEQELQKYNFNNSTQVIVHTILE